MRDRVPADDRPESLIARCKARKDMREMRPAEFRTANLLQELLGAQTFEPRDVGAAQGMHDFDLVFADRRTFAVRWRPIDGVMAAWA